MTIEKSHWHLGGILAWLAFCLAVLALLASPIYFFASLLAVDHWTKALSLLVGPFGLFLVSIVILRGFAVIQPNDALILMFYGSYCGTVKRNGLVLVNPFCSRGRISLKMQNLHGDILKVNDKRGNPIEIGAVVVWHVAEPARAMFDVDSYELFVRIQSEAAVRHLANMYAYDGDGEDTTLRSGVDEVSHTLKAELEQRLSRAGIAIDEARIAHLAYAPEIAMAMLKRQQAEAVISAKRAIVSGAVSIVTSALQELQDARLVDLDEERKAAMVSNLLVVLCSEGQVQPVVNTGTLYS
ncbi:MAG TPA: SPFH domain-containing protein [Candidatus Obscuribacter sp.]|nr:SPFH domain-containing protein [Candidatus Obscuribacter sp.]HMY53749.1 SPFH domain-containing protein [Candidatus Obscuribacter sp.]HNA71872.1 SPFH domain-containing protein [Candidatus Obscuribacter sp.]HNB17140.1 SPFH domain-containing protein [Candidatus Obscuribacter sp.]HND08211.1 SPFH domain-containing protein [Candidatus Obscuribacter sp.]